jgi:hypothetical protein
VIVRDTLTHGPERTTMHRSSLLLTLAAVAALSTAGAAQSRPSPHAALPLTLGSGGVSLPESSSRPVPVSAREVAPIAAREEGGHLIATVLVSGLASAAGLYAGAMTGYAADEHEAGAQTLALGATGAVLGGFLGATTVTRRPGWSFLGSILGTAAGAGVLMGTRLDGGPAALVGFGLVEGFVTALVAAR